MKDLWPDDIKYEEIKAPVTILKEQASLLGKRTKNIAQAKVGKLELNNTREGQSFVYGFFIIAPALNQYRYKLFTISYDIDLYPVYIHVDEDVMKEISPTKKNNIPAESESEFLDVLQKIFNAKKTKKIINAIIAQSVGVELEETQ